MEALRELRAVAARAGRLLAGGGSGALTLREVVDATCTGQPVDEALEALVRRAGVSAV